MCHRPSTRIERFCVRVVTKAKEDSGAELFEAALVLPILLTLLLGIVTFGRAWNTYQTITRAAREGAKAAVLTPCADSTYCSGAKNYTASDIWTNFVNPALQSDNLPTSKVTSKSITYVQLDPNGSPAHVCGLQLQFSYPYTFSLPFTSLNLSTITLKTKVRMRLENQPTTCPVGTSY
ncbi:MAG TPA: TadE/TadG family type IV pilus assembly protein [Terriglobia bacterium]|nr:TadE/TadG family type IV pilus assembly protein [Terriglobia bacterium]